MTSEIIRRAAEQIELVGRIRRLPRSVEWAADNASYRGLIASRRVEAAAYVTHLALQEVTNLTAEEGRAIELCPLGEPRYRVIVDTFAGLAAAEIARLG